MPHDPVRGGEVVLVVSHCHHTLPEVEEPTRRAVDPVPTPVMFKAHVSLLGRCTHEGIQAFISSGTTAETAA